jgi:hypothetical protein
MELLTVKSRKRSFFTYIQQSYLNSIRCQIQGDSKLLSGFPIIGHGHSDNNFESSCATFRIKAEKTACRTAVSE